MITFLTITVAWLVAGSVGFLFSYKNTNCDDRLWLAICVVVFGPLLVVAAIVDEVSDQYYDHSGR